VFGSGLVVLLLGLAVIGVVLALAWWLLPRLVRLLWRQRGWTLWILAGAIAGAVIALCVPAGEGDAGEALRSTPPAEKRQTAPAEGRPAGSGPGVPTQQAPQEEGFSGAPSLPG
jgi:hypothetical protein